MKTLATESTVSSIKSILAGFKSNLDTITTKVSCLAEVLASPEDKQLHDNSKTNLDYVNGDFSSNISDTSKFVLLMMLLILFLSCFLLLIVLAFLVL